MYIHNIIVIVHRALGIIILVLKILVLVVPWPRNDFLSPQIVIMYHFAVIRVQSCVPIKIIILCTTLIILMELQELAGKKSETFLY